MLCEQRFEAAYRRAPDGLAFCPYRICPIGAHVDHNLGRVTGFALDKGIYIAYAAKQNGVIEMASLQFPKRAQWHIASTPANRQDDWADYLRGATLALARQFPLRVGICGVIEGTLPIGGLSSSAAVIISFLTALCRVNGIRLTERQMIETALAAERDYVGVSIGKLDQSCEVLCRENSLLYLDTMDDSCELIPQSPDMKPWEIVIFFSGLEHALTGSGYNTRVDELRAGIYALRAFAGLTYGKISQTHARHLPREVYERYRHRLPDVWARRCEHWYTEDARAQAGAEAWRRGDIEAYGRLCFESGWSSIYNWESGAPEQIRLYEIMTQTDGIYGGRFAGAGFKGCCLALIDPAYETRVAQQVTEAYLKDFPGLRDKYSVHVCRSADGIRL